MSNKRTRLSLLTLLLLLGFSLRLYKLGDQSLWYDETVSAFLASEPLTDLIAHTARDIHPPGYYLLLRLWSLLVGRTEFALAYLSLLFGLLTIPLLYALTRRLLPTQPTIATWAALLMALSPFGVWYAQEVRMYTLGATLGLLMTYSLVRAICQRTPPQSTPSTWTSWTYWTGYAVSASLGIYTLYYFAFLLLTVNLIALGFLLRTPTITSNVVKLSIFRMTFLRNRSLSWPKAVGFRQAQPAYATHLTPLTAYLKANSLIVMAYLPWMPIAWRQITNPPVPPWRTLEGWTVWQTTVEIWTALALGQSVNPADVWPILMLMAALFMLGLITITRQSPPAMALLLLYTTGPIVLINLLSLVIPLYHVRYVFIYSPPFYVFVAAGLWRISAANRNLTGIGFGRLTHRGLSGSQAATTLSASRFQYSALIAAALIMITSLYAIRELHGNPRYQADDYRAAVTFIQDNWQPGDAIIVNAGYAYTAFAYYNRWPQLERSRLVPYISLNHGQPLLLQTGTVDGSPQLGWGDPHADFYAMSAADTVDALEQLSHTFPRVWMLRVYDTVTDKNALIRTWLNQSMIKVEDYPFAGPSYLRVQAFISPHPPDTFTHSPAPFADGLTLVDWQFPSSQWAAGESIPITLWWQADEQPTADYKLSLKLWHPSGQLAAQGEDAWVGGSRYRTTAWQRGQPIYYPTSLTLPADIQAGQYWLNVELYHPDTLTPLSRLDLSDPVATLGAVDVTD